jgi:hypothetical protein
MNARGSRAAFARLAGLSLAVVLASAGGCYIRPVTFVGVDGSGARDGDGASTGDTTDGAAPDATDGHATDATDGPVHDATDGTSDTSDGSNTDATDATDRPAIDGPAIDATDATDAPDGSASDATDRPAIDPTGATDGPAIGPTDATDGPDTTLVTFAIGLAGNGAGTITAPGISCGIVCVTDYSPGTLVTVSAIAADDSTFLGWSGAGCTGTDPCQVTVSAATTLTAAFALKRFQLALTFVGNGNGTVSGLPDRIPCPLGCGVAYDAHTVVTLTATAGSDSTFGGWSGGGCSGTGTCVVTMEAAVSVTAAFALQQAVLTVAVAGNGDGIVTSSPTGISCPTSCSATTDVGTVVTLTATPADSSAFSGWVGACPGSSSRTCQVTVTSGTSVTAVFTRAPVHLAVANAIDPSVEVFAFGADGNVAPVQRIAGASTTFINPRSLALFTGEILVADGGSSAIDVFPFGANGDVAPVQQIAGPSTSLSAPLGVAVFGREIFVCQLDGSIVVFPLEASGDVAPSRTITGIGFCGHLAIVDGEIYALDVEFNRILVFPIGASGSPMPSRIIAGPATQMVHLAGIAISAGEIFVSDDSAERITVFPQMANGNVAPLRTITGDQTQLDSPAQMSIASRELYVPNYNNNSIAVFPVDADGNVAPTRRIFGAITGLNLPIGTIVF